MTEVTLKNGVVYDNEKHRIVKGRLTSAEARAMALKMHEQRRAAFANGVVETLKATGKVPTKGGSDEAWAVVGEKITELLLDAETANDGVKAASFIGRATGWLPSDKELKMQPEQVSMLDNIPPGMIVMIAKMADIVDKRVEEYDIDAEAREAPNTEMEEDAV